MNDSIENILATHDQVEDTQAVDTADETPITQQPVAQASDKEKNFSAIRQKLEHYESRAFQLEREREELARKLANYEQRQQPQEEEMNVSEDELVSGKKLNTYTRTLKNELALMKKQMAEYQQQSQTQIASAQLRAQYPDLDEVVTEDNVRALSRANPALAAMLNSSNDFYNKAATAYTMIKSMGIYNPEANNNKERILNNMAKPKPAASIAPKSSMSPITQVANGFDNKVLTPEMKKTLWNDMKNYASQAPSFSFHPVNN